MVHRSHPCWWSSMSKPAQRPRSPGRSALTRATRSGQRLVRRPHRYVPDRAIQTRRQDAATIASMVWLIRCPAARIPMTTSTSWSSNTPEEVAVRSHRCSRACGHNLSSQPRVRRSELGACRSKRPEDRLALHLRQPGEHARVARPTAQQRSPGARTPPTTTAGSPSPAIRPRRAESSMCAALSAAYVVSTSSPIRSYRRER